MKKQSLLFFFLFISILTFSQKVDLDRFYFNVSFQNLPVNIIPFEQRTYATIIVTDGPISSQFESAKILNNQLYIYGWKKVTEGAKVNVEVNLADFFEEGTIVESRNVEEKDKDGKVISSYPLYTLVTKYRGQGYATITAPNIQKKIAPVPVQAVSKTPNRFIKDGSGTEATTVAPSAEITKKIDLSGSYSYKSSENVSKVFLERENAKNREVNFNKRLREYVQNVILNTNSQINYYYGFEPVSFKEQLWIMDSKEEEGAIQKEAIEAVKALFAEMKADQPIEKLAADLQPLIEYFESLKTKYKEDNKGSKKIRYSAYYNLGKIYLYLDQPEKAIIEGEGLIANDYDKSDGRDLIASGKKLIDKFNLSQIRTRHNPTLN